MAEEDRGNDGPSLELPSFGFKRKRRAKPATTAESTAARARASEPQVTEPPVTEPPVTEPEPPTVDPEPPTVEPDPPLPEREQAVEPAPAPASDARPLYADEVPARGRTRTWPSAAAPQDRAEAEAEAEAPGAEDGATTRRGFTLPAIGGMAASVVTGLLVGVITVGLTWASQRLCEVARGTSSCGGPGFLLLVAILVAMVLLGGALLRAWQVPDPTSTSFLAVGLLAVMTLLFLVDVLFSWWMIIVIPLVAVGTFVLSHWVTTALVEPGEH